MINNKLCKYCQQYEKPTPHSSADEREKFIKNKYELKLYIKPQKTNEREESAKRLAHYFMIVSKDKMILPDKKLISSGKAIMPETIFKCEFNTNITYRYPERDYDNLPLPSRVFDFIFPQEIYVTDKMLSPEQRSFVLTDAEGNKQYGISIIFYERISPMDILNMCEYLNTFRKELNYNEITTMPGAVYSPKAICLLSHWPFYKQFSKYLQTLYRITKTPSVPIPIERYLMNFMYEVPVPPMGKTSVQFVVGDIPITLKRNPPNSLPFLNVDDQLNLFKCLSIRNVLTLFNALLQESKIVLISSHLHLLLEIAETITTLLFPFQLQGVYMPLLPSKLLDFLHSPVPFLAGVHPHWIKGQHYDDVVFVYLDEDQILTTSQSQLEALPKRPKQKLESRIEELLPWLHQQQQSNNQHNGNSNHKSSLISPHKHHEEKKNNDDNVITQEINHQLDLLPISNFLTSGSTILSNGANNTHNKPKNSKSKSQSKSKNNSSEEIFREIQKAFLKFFTSILANYNDKYTVKQKKNDPNIRNKEYVYFKLNKQLNQIEFEKDKFLDEGIDKSFRPFMEKLTQTQLFMAFCQEREELIESKSKEIPVEIKYFDEEIIAKKNRSTFQTKKKKTEFLNDESLDIKSVFVANPPNLNDLDCSEYSYSSFPNQLKKSRFGIVRKVNAPWNAITNKTNLLKRTKSQRLRGNHFKNEQTYSALQQLLAMQHTAHINKTKSWDNFTEHVLVVQRYIRMMLAKNQVYNIKKSVLTTQKTIRLYNETRLQSSTFNKTRKSAVILQSVFKTYLIVQKNKNNVYYQSTTTLQAVFRGYLYQKKFKNLQNSTNILQGILKTYLIKKETKTKLESVQLLQKYLKTSFARTKHINTINSIARCQAVLRGTLLRNQQKKILNMQLSKIRKQILMLWEKTYTAFMYRAKFWIVYEAPTYLNLAIHNEELVRLNNLLNRLQTSKTAANEAKIKFDTEKQELRRLLKEELAQNIRESLYTSWNINIKSKNKKDKLLNELFIASDNKHNPKQSATALLTICSSHSSSILDVTSQVELRKADRIRDNLLLTVFSSLSSMQSLNKSLQKQQKYNRKQKLTINTLNDELSHKQSVIIKQRNKLSEFIAGGHGNHHSNLNNNNHMILSSALSPSKFNNNEYNKHYKNTSSLTSLHSQSNIRRFSESGLHKKKTNISTRSGSDDVVEQYNNNKHKNGKNHNIAIRHQSHNTAAFHSKSRKSKVST